MKEVERTFGLYLLLDTVSPSLTDSIFRGKLEIRSHIVHFLPLQIGNDDINIVTSSVMHTTEKHQFRKLKRETHPK